MIETGHRANFFETSNGVLPLEHVSDRRETSATRVPDDLQHSIFRRQKKVGNFLSDPKIN